MNRVEESLHRSRTVPGSTTAETTVLASSAAVAVEPRARGLPGLSTLLSASRVRTLGRFAWTAGQIGLVLLVFHAYQIEEASGLLRLTALLFGGFLAHAALPLRYRPPFFVALSVAAFAVLLGPLAAVLVTLGVLLVGACHLPIAFRWRVALLAAMTAALGALRAGQLPWAWAQGAWTGRVLPVLGAIFMFRLAIYLYDLRHESAKDRQATTVWRRLSYFFLLPNVCFLLFPVLDYRTFQRTYYNADPLDIYQRGALRIFRGLTHLLLYRVVYYYLAPAPWTVATLGDVVLFVTSAWLLYLRVSGVFHLVVGVLGLFGHNLPEPMRLYFLASGPNDLWRRANIYWKDFMMKLFYYPVFKPLQRRWMKQREGLTWALVVATLAVFFATWQLHSYQWFWVLGGFPLAGIDAAFWTIFAALVLANSLWELKRGKTRTLPRATTATPLRPTWSPAAALGHSAKVLGMFLFMGLMWSWWSTRDTGRWLGILERGAVAGDGRAYALLALGLGGGLAVGVVVHFLAGRGWTAALGLGGDGPTGALAYGRSAVFTSLGAVLLLGASRPAVQAEVLGPRLGGVVASLQRERLNEQDAARQLRGYYETLLDSDAPTSAAAGVAPVQQAPPGWKSMLESDVISFTRDALHHELKPSYRTVFKGALLRTNEWGMRDKAYTLAKPAGTRRIALLGGSITMGSGVEDRDTYEALVEERLNREQAGGPNVRYEILNFAVGGYGLVQNVLAAERKVYRFQPDVVILASHSGEISRSIDVLVRVLESGAELPAELHDLLRPTGLRPGMARAEIRRQLRSANIFRDLQTWSYRELVESCRRRGIVPVWAWVPRLDGISPSETFEYMSAAARAAGFVILDLDDAFKGQDESKLWVAPWDSHPSVEGHQLLANRLHTALLAHDAELRLGLSPSRINQ